VILALWGRQQWRTPNPLINVRSLVERRVLIANVCMMFLALGGLQLGQMFSLYFQQPTATGTGLGFSATVAGGIMFLLNISVLVGGPLSGRIARRLGARTALLAGMATMAVTWGALAVSHGSTVVVMALAVGCSLGLAIAQGGIYNVIVEATPPERTGEATGLTYVFLACFFAVGAQALFALLATDRVSISGGSAATFPSDVAFSLSFGFVSVMAGLAFLTALLLPPHKARDRAHVALDA
jgi:MFS family permease